MKKQDKQENSSLQDKGWEKELDEMFWPKVDWYQNGKFQKTERDITAIGIMSNLKDFIRNLLAQERKLEREAKDQAYWERNQLVKLISKLYPSHLNLHDANDADWEIDWRNIVCIHTPQGQATWHIHDSDMKYFQHLEPDYSCKWDGHTTEEKYERLSKLKEEGK